MLWSLWSRPDSAVNVSNSALVHERGGKEHLVNVLGGIDVIEHGKQQACQSKLLKNARQP